MNVKHKDDICVIGTGRFGQAIISQLLKMGKSVFIIDKDEKSAQVFADEVQRIVITDAADMRVLKSLEIDQFETVVVAVADNIEIVAALLELNIKNIIARATSKRHARVLKQIGVHVIIRPEQESGIRTALIAANDNFIKYSNNLQELDGGFVLGTTIIQNNKIVGVPLKNLGFNDRGITVVLIKRGPTSMRATGDVVLQLNDLVTLIGDVRDVTAALGWCNENKNMQ
ncbi:potassium channel family protein [Mycoplasma crocodyli]|uniref:Potassium uptake protein A n=1 Tax=Mycoplasma crocodyli (strain ATCC 51981 / MP145) TaxID=512564 RepID=D5E5M0_MYCCM|nr:TrkA family potassium uptake protein [Mycoplasma crocodyli]ADE19466.1 potassium uptake protein A [Mycoplasma crocodyli MP145]